MIYEKQKKLLFVSFLVHFIFLVSIFDIYFKSPIIEGILEVENNVPASANRLVLLVADGLRADTFFKQYSKNEDRFLRKIINTRGKWGVNHGRVPTETRPGHIALIAGLYEDPSAIFTGWKHNPIEFDSVFNRSRLTLGWGSPDILSIFSKSGVSNIQMHSFPSDLIEFSGRENSAANLSWWSFNGLKSHLELAEENNVVREQLNQSGTIFFLNLLGVDTSGHADKPHSVNYIHNVEVAETIAERVETMIENYYNFDGKTAYLFVSDHGMTDWGSHGEGLTVETETPFVAWGAGIARPEPYTRNRSVNDADYYIGDFRKIDISHADVAPLMSMLLGVPIPVNSVGTLPLDLLELSEADKSAAIFLNARQMLAQFVKKRETVEKNTLTYFYRPFERLMNEEEILSDLNSSLMNKHYQYVEVKSRQLISDSLLGLDYYHNYYQNLLLFCISASYVGWLLWLFIKMLEYDHTIITKEQNGSYYMKTIGAPNFTWKNFAAILFPSMILLEFVIFAVQSMPYQYYVYGSLPIIIWWNVYDHLMSVHVFNAVGNFLSSPSSIFTIVCSVICVELMVLAFFERGVLTGILIILTTWRSIITYNRRVKKFTIFLWIVVTCLLAPVPFIDPMLTKVDIKLMWYGIGYWHIVMIGLLASVFKMSSDARQNVFSIIPFVLYSALFSCAMFNVSIISESYSAKNGLPLANQLLSWAMLVTVPVVPVFTNLKISLRLLSIYFSLGSVSILFGMNEDILYLPTMCAHLFIWLVMESDNLKLVYQEFGEADLLNKRITADDFRRALFFFFYSVFSFFATVNMASISSFNIQWVRCFITMFAPFTMMTLIFVKIMIPILLTTCTFRAVIFVNKVSANRVFMMMLMFCDVMGLHFLFLVKNVGSWLAIGSSVSHYVIAQSIVLVLVILHSLSGWLTDVHVGRQTARVMRLFGSRLVKANHGD